MARILVIDDDLDIRETVRRILGSRGHAVQEADDGSSGLGVIAETPPDVVILDIFMPERDGFETLRELRKAYPRIKVVAMSGGDSSGLLNLLDDMAELGADWTLPKPFTPKELLAAVQQVLGKDAHDAQ